MRILDSRFYILHSRNGQTVLTLVFVIGGIVILAGLTLAFLATSFVNSVYGYQAAQRAQAVAAAGAYDAMMRLARNKDLGPSTYTMPISNDSASVTVGSASGGLVTITSTATVSLRTRKISAIVSVNSTTGQVTLVSWNQAI